MKAAKKKAGNKQLSLFCEEEKRVVAELLKRQQTSIIMIEIITEVGFNY